MDRPRQSEIGHIADNDRGRKAKALQAGVAVGNGLGFRSLPETTNPRFASLSSSRPVPQAGSNTVLTGFLE